MSCALSLHGAGAARETPRCANHDANPERDDNRALIGLFGGDRATTPEPFWSGKHQGLVAVVEAHPVGRAAVRAADLHHRAGAGGSGAALTGPGLVPPPGRPQWETARSITGCRSVHRRRPRKLNPEPGSVYERVWRLSPNTSSEMAS